MNKEDWKNVQTGITPIQQDIKVGKNIRLREIQKSDLPLIRKWRNQNREWFDTQDVITAIMQEKWYERYLKDDSDILFIIETEDKTPIGTYGFKHIDYITKKAEGGNLILGNEKFAGQGMGAEIVKISMIYAFTVLKLHEIYATQLATNNRAIITHAKAGWRIVGFRKPGILYLSITKEDLND